MKNIILKISSIVLLFCISALGIHAQSEYSVYVGGGITSLKAKINENSYTNKGKTGSIIGIGYSYNISSKLALATGIEYSSYSSDLRSLRSSTSIFKLDDEEMPIQYKEELKGLVREQKASYMQVPFMIRYTHMDYANIGLYFSAGLKIGFLTSKSSRQTIDNVTSSAYYEDLDWTLDDDPQRGFGDLGSRSSKDDMKLKTLCLLSGEVGFKIPLSNKISLYPGFYFDYGLNNLNDENYIIDKITATAFGVKLKLGFSL